ncbi:MAG TPA: PQQ-binding-like beta-propeller repeat protein [Pirellulaceae bacterium]
MNRRHLLLLVISASFLASLWAVRNGYSAETNWPQWRGPLGTGEAPAGKPTIKWDEKTNIQWQVRIPGDGTSTPIIWKDQIFVQTAVPSKGESSAPAAQSNDFRKGKGGPDGKGPPPGKGPPGKGGFGGKGGKGPPGAKGGPPPTEVYQFALMSIDRNSGKTLWSKICREAVPHEGFKPGDGSFAASSAITDGEHVYAFFGSRGLYCYDLAGNLKWEKDLGQQHPRNGFGEGATPALFGNTIVVQWDHDGGPGFVAAIDKRSGQELWRTARNEKTVWSTPVIVEHNGKAQAVLSATNSIRSYDLATGKEVWESEGLTTNVIPTGFTRDDLVYLTSGYEGNKLLAIKLGSSGDANKSIAWRYDRDTPYVPSPLLSGHRLYFLKRNDNILTCLDSRTGKPHYTGQRVEGLGTVYASPVAAGGNVYIVDRDGNTVVIKDADKLEVVSTNLLNDPTDASPAVVGNQLFLRSRKNLYCIGEK